MGLQDGEQLKLQYKQTLQLGKVCFHKFCCALLKQRLSKCVLT